MAEERGKNKNLIERGNPRLLRKLVKNGTEYSLYLEYQMGYNRDNGTSIRKKESLSLYVMVTPRTSIQRQQVKETIELARKIRFEREQQFLENREGYRLKKDKGINFLDFYQSYISSYTKKDIRMIQIAYNRFKDFLAEYHPLMQDFIKPDAITHEMMIKFAEYLQTRSVGEGAKSILQRFKKVVRASIDQGIMAKDPCKGVRCIVDDQMLTKDVLSQEEVQLLINTHYQFEKENVRNAFIFCLYTGMRFCDVKDLRYSSIDYANKLLRFEQDKIKGHSARSWVTIPLNDGLIRLVGKPDEGETRESLIFNLPSYESCCKSVKRWVKRAGIEKHISWHCARHSFAVNILNNGANIKTVASLLGHSGLKHTEKYTRAVDKLKEDAINSLPSLEL
ncbi:MAG: site-specific integrase [Muribaculaceae bacterium]|nr:site-specific integrase [Muribaculaceae bacterium]